MIIKNFSIKILLFLLIPSYLISGGYGVYRFIFLLPLSIFFILTFNIYKQKTIYKRIYDKRILFF